MHSLNKKLRQVEAFREAIAPSHAVCLAALGCPAASFRYQNKLAKNPKLRSAEARVGCYPASTARP
jgi:CRP/FNR family transcriptional regulator, transcriptional activator FtrB